MSSCFECGTLSTIDGARFCTQCGYPIRQECPVCSEPLLVGGADLSRESCPKCGAKVRVCRVKHCGRLHAGRSAVCSCGRKKRLPPPAKAWATSFGPLDRTRTVRCQTNPDVVRLSKQVEIDDDIYALIDDGIHLCLLCEGSVQRPEIEHSAKFFGEPNEESICGADGLTYILQDESLYLLQRHTDAKPEETQVYDLKSQFLSSEMWIGLSYLGELLTDGGLKLGSISTSDDVATCTGSRSVLIRAGGRCWEFDGHSLTEWLGLDWQVGTDVFWHADSFWRVLKSKGSFRVERVTSAGTVFHSGMVGIDSHAPLVSDTGKAFFVAMTAGTECVQVELETGNVTSMEGAKTPFSNVLSLAGVDGPDGFRILIAGRKGREGTLLVMDPQTGSTRILQTPAEARMDWVACQWVVRADTFAIGIRAEEGNWLLEYGT